MSPAVQHLLNQAGWTWVCSTASPGQPTELSLHSWSRRACTTASENQVRRCTEVGLWLLPTPHTRNDGWEKDAGSKRLAYSSWSHSQLSCSSRQLCLSLLSILNQVTKCQDPREENWGQTKRVYLQSGSYCHQKALNISKFTGWFTSASKRISKILYVLPFLQQTND